MVKNLQGGEISFPIRSSIPSTTTSKSLLLYKMKTTLHTPSPWYLDAHDEKGWFLLSESGPDIMAEPFDCSDSDARLISSAPDLLDALDWALRQIEDDLCPDHQAAFDAALSTLRKAKGE